MAGNYLLTDAPLTTPALWKGRDFANHAGYYAISLRNVDPELRLSYTVDSPPNPSDDRVELPPAAPLVLSAQMSLEAVQFCAKYFAVILPRGETAPTVVTEYPSMSRSKGCWWKRYLRCLLEFRTLLVREDRETSHEMSDKDAVQTAAQMLSNAANPPRRWMALNALCVNPSQENVQVEQRISLATSDPTAFMKREPFLLAAAHILCDHGRERGDVNTLILRLMAQVYAVTCKLAREA